MNYALQILLILLLFLWRITAAAASDDGRIPARSSDACSEELVAFSLCLPYVAAFPNNLTDSPPTKCCDDIFAAFRNGTAICLCHFVRRPHMLGFPLNHTRFYSLTYVCRRKSATFKANSTLPKLCSGHAALPPLQSITGPSNTMPHNSGANSPPPPLMSSDQEPKSSPPTEPADELPTSPPTTTSSATEQICRLSKSSLIPLIIISLLYQLRPLSPV